MYFLDAPRKLVDCDKVLLASLENATPKSATMCEPHYATINEASPKADPARVMQYISRYFAAMSHEIMTRSGTWGIAGETM